jgi:hypothetical protein
MKKKIMLALAGVVLAASAPITPAAAQVCQKIDWLYLVDGEYASGWDLIYYVDLATGGDYTIQGAIQWLSQHGFRISVASRYCET